MIYDINGELIRIGDNLKLPLFDGFTKTTLIKHYGGNSASNFITAYNEGFRAVEGDVHFTSDNIPIMNHDPTMGGLTIATSTLAELEAVTTVYKLTDWFKDCRKYNVLAEIDFTKTHTEAQCATLVEYINEYSMKERCTIECYPDTSAIYLSNASDDLILSIFSNTTISEIDAKASFENKCRKIVCVIPGSYATQELVSYAHSKGYLVRAWTGNVSVSEEVPMAISFLEMGVDLVFTNTFSPNDLNSSSS